MLCYVQTSGVKYNVERDYGKVPGVPSWSVRPSVRLSVRLSVSVKRSRPDVVGLSTGFVLTRCGSN